MIFELPIFFTSLSTIPFSLYTSLDGCGFTNHKIFFVSASWFINNNVSTRIFPDFMKSGSFKGLVNYGENLLDDIPQELNQLNNIGNW